MNRATSEDEYVVRAVDGDPEAQRTLYERYHDSSFRLAYLLLRNRLDAEEVVQDAFVYALANLDRYDPERGAFWTWLRVILVSRCRNKRRRKQLSRVPLEVLERVGQGPADPKPTGDPVRALERLDTRRAVWKALQEVSPGARDALVLRYYEGLPYAEIGQLLGCSSAAARSRVVHGKGQLRDLLTSSRTKGRRETGAVCTTEAG